MTNIIYATRWELHLVQKALYAAFIRWMESVLICATMIWEDTVFHPPLRAVQRTGSKLVGKIDNE